MCSVRHSPMPLGAEAAGVRCVLPGVGVGAHTELAAAHCVGPRQDRVELAGGSAAASVIAPRTTSPEEPSREMTSPSLTVTSPAVKERPEILIDSAPTTAGVPQPRVTTAAWLTSPPRAVRMPCDAIIPWTSSGSSRCARGSPCQPRSAAASASSAVKSTLPTAAPGEAAKPWAMTLPLPENPGAARRRGARRRRGAAPPPW